MMHLFLAALVLLTASLRGTAFLSPRPLHSRAQAPCRDDHRHRLQMAIVGPVRYSTEDWLRAITSLPTSKILQRTKYNISFFTIWSFLVTVFFKAFNLRLQLPSQVHSVLGSALGLLLVFRTNTAHDRFWEGRKSQSLIIQACRNIASHAYTHLSKETHAPIAALLTVFVQVQKQHLQGVIDHNELTPLAQFLTNSKSEEVRNVLQTIKRKRNRPIYVIRVIEKFIYESLLEKYRDPLFPETAPRYIEKHFTEATQSLAAQVACCERILKQPVPQQYSRHLSRFLSLFMLTLPFSLVSVIGWLTVPTVSLTCWSFVSIQEIGQYIEEPFAHVIPLNQIASVTRADVSELLDDVLSSPEIQKMDFKLLREKLDPRDPRNWDDSYFRYYKATSAGEGEWPVWEGV